MQCGIASLAMVCRHHGMDYSLDFLSRFCHATAEGVSMLGIAQAARQLGFDTAAVKVTHRVLGELPLPCILHWNQTHFVVLYRISRDGRRFHISDPAAGRRRLDREEFDSHWISTSSGGGDAGIALVLLGELMIVVGRTATGFIRRWLLLHISMRVNISLVSDFFIKLLRLPMSFFDTKLMGDLLQRIGDHSRVQSFLTGQALNVVFTILSFLVFGVVLFVYNPLIFAVFAAGSLCYGLWIASFLRRRKILDYELFERQAVNQNRTYQFITSMQEIKLQDCERRRRWEWEDTQADLFAVQMKSLKLQQTQEAGSIFINEVKNILITVIAATAVIDGRQGGGDRRPCLADCRERGIL